METSESGAASHGSAGSTSRTPPRACGHSASSHRPLPSSPVRSGTDDCTGARPASTVGSPWPEQPPGDETHSTALAGLTFLFTGDSRGDLILEGLEAAGLLDHKGRAAVDLMTVPHLGSSRNVTVDFFTRVRAAGYLFSGNGRHGNPEVGTVAALITARGCDSYQMYFVNRDGGKERSAETMGAKFDAFFKEEQRFHPNYRRVFRSTTGGSVIIDLLTPLHR